MVHICEKKRRHLAKDTKQNSNLHLDVSQLFYKIGTNSKKQKTYTDFVDSHLLSNGFVKFASYCIDP